MKRFLEYVVILLLAMAGFRFLPGLATAWHGAIALPILEGLHRLTATLPFPALEPLAPVALTLCLRRRSRAVTLAVIMGMYGLLWYPAYFARPAERVVAPGDMERLCLSLAEALNDAELQFIPPFDGAREVAGLDWARVKPVRYPEWMRALGIAGLFAPWTGETLVDADAPPGYLPFTCVHELIHLRGVADEGAANITAYRACLEYGGMYADSARLWALRYALGRLDDDARERVTRRMDGRLRDMLAVSRPRDASFLFRIMGIGESTRDYYALLGWIYWWEKRK